VVELDALLGCQQLSDLAIYCLVNAAHQRKALAQDGVELGSMPFEDFMSSRALLI